MFWSSSQAILTRTSSRKRLRATGHRDDRDGRREPVRRRTRHGGETSGGWYSAGRQERDGRDADASVADDERHRSGWMNASDGQRLRRRRQRVRRLRLPEPHQHAHGSWVDYGGWFGTPSNNCSVGPTVTRPANLVARCGAKSEPYMTCPMTTKAATERSADWSDFSTVTRPTRRR